MVPSSSSCGGYLRCEGPQASGISTLLPTVAVDVTLPAQGTFIDIITDTNHTWVCPAPSGGHLKCTQTALVPGDAPTLSLIWKAPSPGGFDILVSATVSASSHDPDATNDTTTQAAAAARAVPAPRAAHSSPPRRHVAKPCPEEPDAGVLHVRIHGGPGGQPPSLPDRRCSWEPYHGGVITIDAGNYQYLGRSRMGPGEHFRSTARWTSGPFCREKFVVKRDHRVQPNAPRQAQPIGL